MAVKKTNWRTQNNHEPHNSQLTAKKHKVSGRSESPRPVGDHFRDCNEWSALVLGGQQAALVKDGGGQIKLKGG